MSHHADFAAYRDFAAHMKARNEGYGADERAEPAAAPLGDSVGGLLDTAIRLAGITLPPDAMGRALCETDYLALSGATFPDSVTYEEMVELCAKYEVLKRDYKRQHDAFYRAFLIANDLLMPYNQDNPPSKAECDLDDVAKSMATGITKSKLHRQLEMRG